MQKKIISDKAAFSKITEGVDLVCDAVKSTISPNGRTVIVSECYVADYSNKKYPILVTKDGYKVSTKIDSTDPEVGVGVAFAQAVAEKQMVDAGDATSTACLFFQTMLKSAIAEIESGKSHVKIKNSINEGVENIVEQLKKTGKAVNGDIQVIKKIATTSANNDVEVGNLIADAYEKIGENGVIKIEKAKGRNTSIKVTGGITFGKGWVSQHFVNAPKGECHLQNPFVLIYDEHLVPWKDIEPLLVKINQINGINGSVRPLMVFCNRADGEALAALIINHQKGAIPSCVVQMDFLGEKKVDFMKDLAAATGAKYISENTGLKLCDAEISDLGGCESVVVSMNETTVIGGYKDDIVFNKLVSDIETLEKSEEDVNEKDLLQKRIARLTSSVAVLSVGGVTDVEAEEKLDRVDDAVRAVKSAIEEGYLPGGGTAFLRMNPTGDMTVDSILELSLKQICENSGVDFDVVKKDVKEKSEYFGKTEGFYTPYVGYNAKIDKVENLIFAGIIEPVKSNRCALQNAASIVNAIISSKFMVTDSL